MTDALFCSLESIAIASAIRSAQHSVCYAAPGIQAEPATRWRKWQPASGPS